MRKIHKIFSSLILLAITFITFLFEAKMTDTTSQSLVTFFSVVFGFYMTSIAILYNAAYTKRLHQEIDPELQKSGTHILKSYFLTSGYWSIFSIISVVTFTVCTTKDNAGILYVKINPLTLPFIDKIIDINLLFSSILFGISALNIFYMLLLMNIIIDGLVEESKE